MPLLYNAVAYSTLRREIQNPRTPGSVCATGTTMGIHSKQNNTCHTSRMRVELITCERRSNWGACVNTHADHPPEILHPYTSKRSAIPVSQVTGRIRTKRVSVGLGSIVLATSVGLVLPWKICEKGSKLLMENIELICRVEMSVRPWPRCINPPPPQRAKAGDDCHSVIKVEKIWVYPWTQYFCQVFCDETDFFFL